MEKEIWKDIVGYEGIYEVSNLGRVKTLAYSRPHSWANTTCHYSDKILKPDDAKGYKQVKLCKNKTYKVFKVHRLVAISFIPNNENKSEVNHIDGNKGNNYASNLEWCTSTENHLHAIKIGLHKTGFDRTSAKITKKSLKVIKKQIAEGIKSQEVIAQQHGVSRTIISLIKRKKLWNI